MSGAVASAETLQYSFRTMLDASKLRQTFPPDDRWTKLVKDLLLDVGGQLLIVDLIQQLEVCHKSVIVISGLPKMSASALWALQQLTSEPGQISIGGHAVPSFKALVVVMAEVADLEEVQEMAEYDVEVVRQLRTAVEESKGGAEKVEVVTSMLKNVDFVAPILDHVNS
eukprot:gene2819-12563_t